MAGFARIYRLYYYLPQIPFYVFANALPSPDATKFVTRAVTFSVELTTFVNHIVRVLSLES